MANNAIWHGDNVMMMDCVVQNQLPTALHKKNAVSVTFNDSSMTFAGIFFLSFFQIVLEEAWEGLGRIRQCDMSWTIERTCFLSKLNNR